VKFTETLLKLCMQNVRDVALQQSLQQAVPVKLQRSKTAGMW